MKNKTCCFTGHRTVASTDLSELVRKLDETLEALISQGVVYFGSGGAIGFDTLAAQAVLRQRERNPVVKLIMVLPCSNQDERWSATDKNAYHQLLAAADKVTYVSEQSYFDGCMAARNKHLVRHSAVCIAYMKHGRSGTSQTVRLAKEQGLKVINLSQEMEEH